MSREIEALSGWQESLLPVQDMWLSWKHKVLTFEHTDLYIWRFCKCKLSHYKINIYISAQTLKMNHSFKIIIIPTTTKFHIPRLVYVSIPPNHKMHYLSPLSMGEVLCVLASHSMITPFLSLITAKVSPSLSHPIPVQALKAGHH